VRGPPPNTRCWARGGMRSTGSFVGSRALLFCASARLKIIDPGPAGSAKVRGIGGSACDAFVPPADSWPEAAHASCCATGPLQALARTGYWFKGRRRGPMSLLYQATSSRKLAARRMDSSLPISVNRRRCRPLVICRGDSRPRRPPTRGYGHQQLSTSRGAHAVADTFLIGRRRTLSR